MIAKKVAKLVIILLLAGLLFAVGYWLIQTIISYQGQCTYGFIDSHTSPCTFYEYLGREWIWVIIPLYLTAAIWVPATIIIALVYAFNLSAKKTHQNPVQHTYYRLYTMLGIVTGLVLVLAESSFQVLYTKGAYPRPLPFHTLYLLLIFAAPLTAGIFIDRYKNSKRASNKTPTIWRAVRLIA